MACSTVYLYDDVNKYILYSLIIVFLHYFFIMPGGFNLGCIPLGWSGFGSVIQDLSGSWW